MRFLLRPAPLFLLVAIAITGCVPQTTPPPAKPAPSVPVSAPAPTPAPVARDWQDWPVTPGTWRYERDARGSRALFGAPGSEALAVLRCDLGSRTIYLSRAGSAAGAMTVRTTSTTRALTVQPTGGDMPYVAVALAPRDALLDAIAFSRGRFTMEQPGVAPLVLRPWAEVSRVIEDCRA